MYECMTDRALIPREGVSCLLLLLNRARSSFFTVLTAVFLLGNERLESVFFLPFTFFLLGRPSFSLLTEHILLSSPFVRPFSFLFLGNESLESVRF